MARRQAVDTRVAKKRRDVPPKVVDSEHDSQESDDDGVRGDAFQGVSVDVDVESDHEEAGLALGFESGSAEGEERMARVVGPSGRAGVDESDKEDSMDGSRSRSEEDLRDIGSARRLDDDDTGDSAWKVAAPSSSSGPDVVVEKGKSEEMAMASASASGGVEVGRESDGEEGGEEADAMETGDEGEDEEEEAGEGGSESDGQPSASVSLEGGSDSDKGSGGKGDDTTKSSAYSRAFSKILQQSKAAKESDTGPVLAQRQTLVARKLEEEAGETKEKKDTRKEKKELREKAHVHPESFTNTKEKDLIKLATRGVVKLFNAVSKAQKVQASADGRDAKVVAKQSKLAFLAGVRGPGTSAAVGSKRSLSSASAPPFKFGTSESQNQPTSRWSVVKDDFMLGKQKLKDWDKDEEMGDAAGVQQSNNRIDDDSD